MKQKVASGNYRGLVTFSDIHAHVDKLAAGIRYAIKNNLFIVFLGDLIDGHDKPLETVLTVKKMLDEDRAAFIIGNHDDKFYRHAKGKKVIFKSQAQKTLADVPKDKMDLFLQTIVGIVEHPNSAYVHRYANWTFVHGGAHTDLWADQAELSSKAKHRALYGEVLKPDERDEEGYPIRTYGWVDEIPQGQNVIVGHDRDPMGKGKLYDTGPRSHTGTLGGRAVFTDMGCGKSVEGKLCLTVFKTDGDNIELKNHEVV